MPDIPTDIPIVDMSHFSRGDATLRRKIALEICDVSRSLGFVYLTQTGIDVNAVDEMFATSATLFSLPALKKNEYRDPRVINNRLLGGYVPYGREHEDAQTPSDIKEAYDIFAADGYYRAAFPSALQPSSDLGSLQPLCDIFVAFIERCSLVASDVLRAFEIGLGLEPDYFVGRHGQNNILRLLHYPPIVDPVLTGQMRAGEHTDFGSVTLLFLNESGGLEVQTADGSWIAAPSIRGTILVNIGDLLQQWTNREFRSTVHRVTVPESNVESHSRYSTAFFCEPNSDARIECLPACTSPTRPALFEPVRAGDHLRGRLNQTLIEQA